jgi:hypothetical protein
MFFKYKIMPIFLKTLKKTHILESYKTYLEHPLVHRKILQLLFLNNLKSIGKKI